MRSQTLQIILAVSAIFLCVSCGGPNVQASDEWENICEGDVGQNIYQAIDSVDGYAFQLVERNIDLDSGQQSEKIGAQRLGYLFSKTQKSYKYIEFDLTPELIPQGFWPVDGSVVPGHYRAELRDLASPNCRAAKALPPGAGLVSNGTCIYAFKTDQKMPRYLVKQIVTSYHGRSTDGDIQSVEWIISDTNTGKLLARSKTATISWSHLTPGSLFMPFTTASAGEGKVCPEGLEEFHITDVLRPY